MSDVIKVDSASLESFKASFAKAGSDYKENLVRLTRLINEITNGDIKGDLATELKAKFDDKQAIFNKIAEIIDEGEEYLGLKNRKFTDMISSTKGSFK